MVEDTSLGMGPEVEDTGEGHVVVVADRVLVDMMKVVDMYRMMTDKHWGVQEGMLKHDKLLNEVDMQDMVMTLYKGPVVGDK